MKIRIKGNSVRIRLTKPEVDHFKTEGYIEEQTEFGNTTLTYTLKRTNSSELAAKFENNTITMLLPEPLAEEWVKTNRVGFEGAMPLGDGKQLYLLLEKDFKCLDESIEDQSDNYDNPLAAKHQ